jgi:hypothetical protein
MEDMRRDRKAEVKDRLMKDRRGVRKAEEKDRLMEYRRREAGRQK